MRNNRRAIGALLLAGAAYAWNNRERLSQQLRALRGHRDGSPPSPRYALPDLKDAETREFDVPRQEWNEREINGTRM